VGEIITDENWYDYIKLFAAFSAEIGYRGFLLFIDECVNLYKISNRQSRENNYEKLLAMFNDVMQGKIGHLGLYLAGTPQFVEDERRGLWSYAALKSRLADHRFVREGRPDFSGPILRLQQLTRERNTPCSGISSSTSGMWKRIIPFSLGIYSPCCGKKPRRPSGKGPFRNSQVWRKPRLTASTVTCGNAAAKNSSSFFTVPPMRPL
jgi:hypothetical protein